MEYLAKQTSKTADLIETPAGREFDFKRELLNFLNRSNSVETRRTYAVILREFFAFVKLKFRRKSLTRI